MSNRRKAPTGMPWAVNPQATTLTRDHLSWSGQKLSSKTKPQTAVQLAAMSQTRVLQDA
jgi:hypothetical protein